MERIMESGVKDTSSTQMLNFNDQLLIGSFVILETRRDLEPKYVPQLFLGWLLGTRWSALIREVKHHVHVKRQTRICTPRPSFIFTCRLLFIFSTYKLVVSRNSSIHKNKLFEMLFSAHFLL